MHEFWGEFIMLAGLCEAAICCCDDTNSPRRAAAGLRVCTSCRNRFTTSLQAMPSLYRACEQALTSSAPTQEKVSGRRPYGINLNAATVDARQLVRKLLVSWCDLVVSERACAWPVRTVPATARFLYRHADWLCAHPAAGDAVSELAELTAAARRAAFPSWTRKLRVGPCVHNGCDGSLIAFVRSDEQLLPSEVCCDVDTGHAWPAHLWRELDREVSGRSERAIRWLSVAEVTRLWNTSATNVYRLASEHAWRRRTAGRRVYYHESDVAASIDNRVARP